MADEFHGSNLGYRIRAKEGYVPVPPPDSLADCVPKSRLRSASAEYHVECHHHEVATAGPCEIDFRFSNLVRTADNLQIFKYIVQIQPNVRQGGDVYAEAALR